MHRFLLSVSCFVLIGAPAHAAVLEITVQDEDAKPLPCRILVKGTDGKGALPNGERTVPLSLGPDQWFMSPGTSKIDVAAGAVDVRIERGHEYQRYKASIEVAEAGASKTIVLKRWIDMRERGYLCGENHLHVDGREVGPMAIAEGLDFGSSLTWWNGPDARRLVPDGSGRHRTLAFEGREITASIYDAELEHGWGAVYIQNLPAPFPFPSNRNRPNIDFLRHAVRTGAIVHYQGGWSREVGLDALLGFVHTANVCNNNFHLHKFQPRSRYSNLLKVDGFPVYPDTEEGMLRMNTDTYYRLLNWGLRLAAGAGSATGAKQTPVGYNRAYVRVASNASLEAFNEAWKLGKNFATNGPMLFLSTKDGHHPGDTLELTGPTNTEFIVEAVSDFPLTSIELIVNGTVVQTIDGNGSKAVKRTIDVSIDRGSWIAARCVAYDDWLTDEELAAYRHESSLSEEPSRIRFAHTSPIYAHLGGHGARIRRSLDEGLRMIHALGEFSESNCAEEFRQSFDEDLRKGREILENRIVEANLATVGTVHPLAAHGITSLLDPDLEYAATESSVEISRFEGIRASFIDNRAFTRSGGEPGHRAGYNGIASLSLPEKHENLFVPSYAGLNFEHIHDGTTAGLLEKFEPRKFPMALRSFDDRQANAVEVYQPPTGNWKLESCGRYTVLEDGAIEYVFECIPHAVDYRNDYIGLFWASYIHQPESTSIFFMGRPRDEPGAEPRWIEGITAKHGVDSPHGPVWAPELPQVDEDFPLTLVNHPSSYVYTEPWYYGISNGKAFVQMFRARDGIWFAQSPSGGGEGNPAWDFQWFVRNPKRGEAYGFIMRAMLLPFTDREKIIEATAKHRKALAELQY